MVPVLFYLKTLFPNVDSLNGFQANHWNDTENTLKDIEINNTASHYYYTLVKMLLNYSYIPVGIYYFSLVKENFLQRLTEALFHNPGDMFISPRVFLPRFTGP